jgi:hypothetical protein
MTEGAFQWKQMRSVEFAAIVTKKCTAAVGIFIDGEESFTAFEGGGKHTESLFRGDFQHHTVFISSMDCPGSFSDGPPAGARAISQTHIAGTRLGRRIFFLES